MKLFCTVSSARNAKNRYSAEKELEIKVLVAQHLDIMNGLLSAKKMDENKVKN